METRLIDYGANILLYFIDQDHMFVLKTLIDKYTNKGGDKLFTCFVDFKKAFDSVIHPGMKIKLKELNISGKFHDVKNSMYSKTKLYVTVD